MTMTAPLVTLLRVHGGIHMPNGRVLICRACFAVDDLCLLARESRAVAVCACGAAIADPQLDEQLVLTWWHDNQCHVDAVVSSAATTTAEWPPDLLAAFPHLPRIAADLPLVHAEAMLVAVYGTTDD